MRYIFQIQINIIINSHRRAQRQTGIRGEINRTGAHLHPSSVIDSISSVGEEMKSRTIYPHTSFISCRPLSLSSSGGMMLLYSMSTDIDQSLDAHAISPETDSNSSSSSNNGELQFSGCLSVTEYAFSVSLSDWLAISSRVVSKSSFRHFLFCRFSTFQGTHLIPLSPSS